MTIQRILPLAALATALTVASHAGAQVTTGSGTQQDSTKAGQTTSAGSGSMGTQTPTTPATPTTNPTTSGQNMDATTPPATQNNTTTNQSNMSGMNMNATTTNQSNLNGACSGTNASADCTSGLVRPSSGNMNGGMNNGNMNGDMNTGGRRHMRVGKDHMDNMNNGTGTNPSGI